MAQITAQQPELANDETTQFESYWSWSSWQVILLIVNASLGLILFEWAWWKNRRFR